MVSLVRGARHHSEPCDSPGPNLGHSHLGRARRERRPIMNNVNFQVHNQLRQNKRGSRCCPDHGEGSSMEPRHRSTQRSCSAVPLHSCSPPATVFLPCHMSTPNHWNLAVTDSSQVHPSPVSPACTASTPLPGSGKCPRCDCEIGFTHHPLLDPPPSSSSTRK